MSYFNVIDLDRKNKGAFGELLVCQNTTLLHHYFDYNINSESNLTYTSGTGTITQDNNTALLQTGTTTNGVAHLRSRKVAAYSPGVGLEVRFTCSFNAASVNDGYTLVGIGNSDSLSTFQPKDGYFIGYNKVSTSTTSFCVFRYFNGSVAYVTSANFSVDKLDGTGPTGINLALTYGKIHVWRILFQWLGAGSIQYQIEDPNTGQFLTFHEIKYASANALPATYNPSFKFFATAFNFNAANNVQLRIPCAVIAMNGGGWLTNGLTWSRSSIKTIVGLTETALLTIRNKSTYASITNRAAIKIKQVSFASDGTKVFLFKCIINTTLTTPSFTDNSTNTSCVDFDTAGTITAGTGRIIASYTISKTSDSVVDVDNVGIYIYPGETFTISTFSTQAGDAYASIVWTENL